MRRWKRVRKKIMKKIRVKKRGYCQVEVYEELRGGWRRKEERGRGGGEGKGFKEEQKVDKVRMTIKMRMCLRNNKEMIMRVRR